MAQSAENFATYGLKGKINLFVFRQRYGKTIVSQIPARTAPLSATQEETILTFKQAVIYAKSILQDAAIKLAYKSKAKLGQTAFNRAIADFFKAPVIGEINLDELSNHAGSSILALVTDDFKVVSVKVKIEKANGTLVEAGDAILQADGLHWKYQVTQAGANATGNKVSIVATDLPGHSSVEQKTI